MITFIFLFVCYGACNNLIHGSLFEGFRNFLKRYGTGGYSIYHLFTCWMCLGTWMGFAISAMFIFFGVHLPLDIANPIFSIFIHGLLSAGGLWLLNTVQEYFEN